MLKTVRNEAMYYDQYEGDHCCSVQEEVRWHDEMLAASAMLPADKALQEFEKKSKNRGRMAPLLHGEPVVSIPCKRQDPQYRGFI